MTFAKLASLIGVIGFVLSGVGILGTGAMAFSAVTLLIAAIGAAVGLEERDVVEGLVVHLDDQTVPDTIEDLAPEGVTATAA